MLRNSAQVAEEWPCVAAAVAVAAHVVLAASSSSPSSAEPAADCADPEPAFALLAVERIMSLTDGTSCVCVCGDWRLFHTMVM